MKGQAEDAGVQGQGEKKFIEFRDGFTIMSVSRMIRIASMA
jgi:hypothetical protein